MKLKKLKNCKYLTLFCLFFLFFTEYSFACSPVVLPKKEIYISKKFSKEKFSFLVELAKSDEERNKGLQCRNKLNEKEGMLFIWKSEKNRFFWMKKTRIPLDLIFINSDLEIVEIFYNALPNDLNVISSKEKAMYVLELNAGVFKSLNLKLGDNVVLNKTKKLF